MKGGSYLIELHKIRMRIFCGVSSVTLCTLAAFEITNAVSTKGVNIRILSSV
jgi:hypothetical protein